jgi:hypothetical protein
VKKKLSLLATPVILAAMATPAIAGWDFDLHPYIGADAQLRHMEFKKNYGSNLFKQNYAQGNVYAGLKFNSYLAVELGFESTVKKHATRTLGPTDLFLGTISDATVITNTNFQLYGPHADLVGFIPFCQEYDLAAILSVGAARLRASATSTVTTFEGFPVELFEDKFRRTKYVLRLGAGLQQMLCDCLGVRAMVNWENTNKMSLAGTLPRISTTTQVKLKNSFIYSLGVFATF